MNERFFSLNMNVININMTNNKYDIEDSEQKFPIDFFELLFLMEACIPPRPIARTMFWQRVCEVEYFRMSDNQRITMYKFLNGKVDPENKDGLLFLSRFNPYNQYLVTTQFKKQKPKKQETFLMNGYYHLDMSTTIHEDYIIDIEKIKELK